MQIEKNLKSLERCQSLEEIQRLYEAGDYKAVVRLLRPTLCFSGYGRTKHLEFVISIPERPAQLLLLQVGLSEGSREGQTGIASLDGCSRGCQETAASKTTSRFTRLTSGVTVLVPFAVRRGKRSVCAAVRSCFQGNEHPSCWKPWG